MQDWEIRVSCGLLGGWRDRPTLTGEFLFPHPYNLLLESYLDQWRKTNGVNKNMGHLGTGCLTLCSFNNKKITSTYITSTMYQTLFWERILTHLIFIKFLWGACLLIDEKTEAVEGFSSLLNIFHAYFSVVLIKTLVQWIFLAPHNKWGHWDSENLHDMSGRILLVHDKGRIWIYFFLFPKHGHSE